MLCICNERWFVYKIDFFKMNINVIICYIFVNVYIWLKIVFWGVKEIMLKMLLYFIILYFFVLFYVIYVYGIKFVIVSVDIE